jgi:hypothetical protein
MVEKAENRGPARGQRAVVKRHGVHCETRYVKELGLDLPTEMAAKFERHLKTQNPSGTLGSGLGAARISVTRPRGSRG